MYKMNEMIRNQYSKRYCSLQFLSQKVIQCPLHRPYNILPSQLFHKKIVSINFMSHRQSNQPYPVARNSTIKQEQELNAQNNLQNDSSISLREGPDVHYYDLDYSDEHQNNDIVSSSDEEGREITHEEFMQMISTNMERKSKSSQGSNSQESQQQYREDYEEEDNEEYEREQQQQMRYERRKPHVKKYPQSNDFKQAYYQQNKKKNSPSTRDKSYNFYQYAYRQHKNSRNDPQKSNEISKHIKRSKEASYQDENSVNTVKQFKIDSFSYSHIHPTQKDKSKAWKQYRQMKPQPKEQDSSFSLITLPEYDEESSSLQSMQRKPQVMIEKQNQMKRLNKYKNVAKIQESEQNAYDKLNWRYQEAKLKFMDSFLPESMKIGNNGYNMLKYMARKNELTFNILKVL